MNRDNAEVAYTVSMLRPEVRWLRLHLKSRMHELRYILQTCTEFKRRKIILLKKPFLTLLTSKIINRAKKSLVFAG